jgi:hypothetical protein
MGALEKGEEVENIFSTLRFSAAVSGVHSIKEYAA